MKKINIVLTYMAVATLIISLAAIIGCEVSQPNTVIRNVEVDFTGLYEHSGGRVVSQNTGNSITRLDLRQTGDQLEAIDNNGIIFRGTIDDVVDGAGTFVLEGSTTAGQKGTISGSLTQNGDSSAEMRGTWIEDSIYGTVFAEATIPSNSEPVVITTNSTNASLRIQLDEMTAANQPASSLWFMREVL